jgi:hypothetical protein
MKKTLLAISDGNGVDNDFKKWPTLLQLMTLDSLQVKNKSVIGASNELILMQVAESIEAENIDCAIIQWTIPTRIDLVADEFWKEQASIDPVYHFNIVQSNNQDWWVTSSSNNQYIKEYHNRYIKEWQSIQRSQSYMLAAAALLKNKNISFIFTLAYEFKFNGPMAGAVEDLPWIEQDLSSFRLISTYKDLDQGLAQPHSAVQLEWLDTIVKPNCDFIDYDTKRYYNIQKHLTK